MQEKWLTGPLVSASMSPYYWILKSLKILLKNWNGILFLFRLRRRLCNALEKSSSLLQIFLNLFICETITFLWIFLLTQENQLVRILTWNLNFFLLSNIPILHSLVWLTEISRSKKLLYWDNEHYLSVLIKFVFWWKKLLKLWWQYLCL